MSILDKTTRNLTLAWIGGVPIAIINGTVRNYVYSPYMEELLAHQISCFTGIALFSAYFWMLNRRWMMTSQEQAIRIGLYWLILTIVFEFLFGHYVMGNTWERLFHDYNVFAGRLWSLVLIWITVQPLIVFKLSSD